MRLASVCVVLAALAAVPSLAAEKAPTVDTVIVAQHRQWTADHDKWHAQHLEMAKRLEAVAAKLRTSDTSFDEHGTELRMHGETLAKPGDAAVVATAHARLASEHEDARIAHHELVDSVSNIEALVDDDRKTEASEAPAPR